MFTNKAIAATYARVLKEAESAGGDRVAQIEKARKIWSQGFVAEAIDRFCRTQAVMDVSGTPHKGVLTGEDMAKWQARVEAPLTYDYRNYTVCKAPWSQGPVTLQQLALLKGFNLDGMDVVGPDFIHLLVECSKLAYADREKFYGDPDFVQVPFDTLLSDAYNDERRKLVTDTASMELRPGSVEGFGALVKLKEGAKLVAGMGAGEPTVGRMGEVVGDTVHFDIVDQAGNMVTSTPSGGWLQSSPVIPELGFGLGTRMQMFWLEEGHPASLVPGKRPRTTLSPTLALRDGLPYLAWGSPGGDQQDQWITQFFLRHVHAGMNLQEAIDAPAWHSEHFPDFVLATHLAARRAADREARAEGNTRRAFAPRPQDRGRAGMVGGPPHRGLAARPAPPCRRQSARHAGICRGPVAQPRRSPVMKGLRSLRRPCVSYLTERYSELAHFACCSFFSRCAAVSRYRSVIHSEICQAMMKFKTNKPRNASRLANAEYCSTTEQSITARAFKATTKTANKPMICIRDLPEGWPPLTHSTPHASRNALRLWSLRRLRTAETCCSQEPDNRNAPRNLTKVAFACGRW